MQYPEFVCKCQARGSITEPHHPRCDRKYEHYVQEKYEFLKKLVKDLKKSKVGNSEIFESGKLYHYAITLTGHSCYKKIIKSIQSSKMFGVTHLCYGEEQNANDEQQGWVHIHLLVRSTKFIDSKEVFVKNKRQRVDVKLLRSSLALMKWHRYIHKETTFGECCVDTKGAEIKFLVDNICQQEN